jgi:hypothetical protein
MLFLLLGDGGFPLDVAAVRAVVVAHEEPRVVGQAEDLLDRVVERAGIAAGEVGARRAAVGHEQRVADEGRVAHHMVMQAGVWPGV